MGNGCESRWRMSGVNAGGPVTDVNARHATRADDRHGRRASLGYTAVDGDVSGLAGLAQLTFLNLYGTAVDGDVSGLAGLAQLTTLNLRGTAVDGDVSGLAGLAQLSSLSL